MMAALVLALLFVLLAASVPVGFAMGIAGSVGLMALGGPDLLIGIMRTSALSSVRSYELITIPMFLLMAEFVLLSRVAEDLFQAIAAWVGRVPGGLGIATALAGAGFGAICGSSTVAAATLASTSLPAMLERGYEPRLAAGVVAISGTLAMLLPTSIALVLYGILADVSVGKLLVSGIVPALFITGVIVATVFLLVHQDRSRAPAAPPLPMRERLLLLRKVWPMLLLFGVVTGIIYSGIATPTEASSIGALGAFALAIAGRRCTPRQWMAAFGRAAQGSCMIASILLGAAFFSYFFTLDRVAQDIVGWVGGLHASRWVVITIVLACYIVLGSFMDQVAILILTVPVVVPLVRSLGFDLIWFGVIKIVMAEIGLITPPIGLNCFIVARFGKRRVGEVFGGIWPHFVAHLLAIAVLVAFPAIILWLPSRM